jgi:glyoxylase-like metal-dependent hydrolase (beta-lactamase superfamily II)
VPNTRRTAIVFYLTGHRAATLAVSKRGIGRTDLLTATPLLLQHRNGDDPTGDTVVYPGHGPPPPWGAAATVSSFSYQLTSII